VGMSALIKGCTGTTTTGGAGGANCSTSFDVSKGEADAGNPDCIVTPALTEGPYYLNLNLVRQDITEGKAGAPLSLTIKLVQATSCTPITGAAVDVWHCDALGLYSGEAANNTVGKTFLRGTQLTDANGEVTFDTIYPGWYSGRTVHIHAKAHLSSNRIVTTQFVFPDGLTDTVFADQAPYNTRAARDTRNSCDMVVQQSDHGDPIILKIAADGSGGYTATITIGVT
jgi:protocatechuate 3,4-dioxygenase beta subunit